MEELCLQLSKVKDRSKGGGKDQENCEKIEEILKNLETWLALRECKCLVTGRRIEQVYGYSFVLHY